MPGWLVPGWPVQVALERVALERVAHDWLVLPGYNWDAATRAAGASASRAQAPQQESEGASAAGWRVGNRSFTWLAASCGTGAECAIYGGIAAGAGVAGWKGTWPLAIAAVIGVSVAEVAATCARARKGEAAAPAAPGPVAPGPSAPGPAAPPAAPGPAAPAPEPGTRERDSGVGSGRWRACRCPPGWCSRSSRWPFMGRGSRSSPCSRSRRSRLAGTSPGSAARPAAAGQDAILACRDDGLLASLAGRLVQGNLMPLPPVVAGLAAILLLALSGSAACPGSSRSRRSWCCCWPRRDPAIPTTAGSTGWCPRCSASGSTATWRPSGWPAR